MLKTKMFDVEPWGCIILFYYGDGKEFERFAKKKFDLDIEANGLLGITSFDDDLPTIVWVNKIENVPTICHELLHAVSHILRSRGVEHIKETEEVYAYTMSELLRRILSTKKWNNVK